MMNYRQALDYLNSFINYEKNLHEVSPTAFRLERVQRLLLGMGQPQKDLQFVHIAGTKGKGSSCAIIANVLKKGGYRVGLFTSPHLNDVRERIRILEDGRRPSLHGGDIFPDCIQEDELALAISETKEQLEKYREDKVVGNLTFFEALTAIALYYFSQEKCDVVVLETGLGGRLDATNSVQTLVCGITPVSMEHMHLLGDSLDKIAYEKAAIIKNKGQEVVLAPQAKDALDVLVQRCNQYNIKPVLVGEEITYQLIQQDHHEMVFDLKTPDSRYSRLTLGLIGRHQVVNAALAVGVIETLARKGFPVSAEAIYEGLKTVRWPGRLEVLQEDPWIVLDGAHNKVSAEVMADTVKEIFPDKKTILIFGVSQLKDVEGICGQLSRLADIVIATKSNHPRAYEFTAKDIERLFPQRKYFLTETLAEALKVAKEYHKDNEILLISGSLYLVSEAREICISSKV